VKKQLIRKYKLLVSDVDGTLLGRDGSISSENKAVLDQVRALGIKVSLCTGRVPGACGDIVRQLGLDGYHIFFDGALVSNPDQTHEVYVHSLNLELVKEAVLFARQENIFLELYSSRHLLVERENWVTDMRHKSFGLESVVMDLTKLPADKKIVKAEIVTSNPDEEAKAEVFRERFRGKLHLSVAGIPSHPGMKFINIVDPGVSKGRALIMLASFLGISPVEVMAIGDNTNDVPLFSAVGLAVAMGNAPDEVKMAAQVTTLDVDSGGLAAAVKRFLL
jgi:5-amino-6-(5-phospho-D-ribitylamino)uracil phosphatase